MQRSLVLVFGLAAVAPLAAAGEAIAPPLRVTVDPRVELLSIIFHLAGNREYNQARVPSYAADVESHFGKFRSHPVVQLARRLRRTRGVSYDACMSMAVHLTDAVRLREAVPLKPRPAGLDARWRSRDARQFLGLARRFVKESKFAAFLKGHDALYKTSVERARKVVGKARLDWFEQFFGSRPRSGFTLILGMLNGPACYGPSLRRKKGEDFYCVLGVWSVDKQGQPKFDPSMLATIAHEFCHSYVNPLVDRHRPELEKAATTLYAWVRDAMKRQAYGNWGTMMSESMVRACVVRYVSATQGAKAAEAEIRAQIGRHFLWTRELSGLLAKYENDRTRYPTLDGYFARITAFFDEYAPRFEREMKKKRAQTPRLVSITPANGATDVDPRLATITVTFDRPMRNSWAFVGGGPHFPETRGRPSYDAARKVVTLPVKLKPNWDYEFWLNRGKFQAFLSAGGVALEPVHVRFRTGDPR